MRSIRGSSICAKWSAIVILGLSFTSTGALLYFYYDFIKPIVKVHEVIQEAGLWGMVMEYVNGDDLGVYVDKYGHLSEDEALHYINQVGQALEYVHQQNFLHRDIKPNNIILRNGKQEAVLIDFGLAREFTIGKTLSMTNSKTEGYAPIEQYERHGRFTAATDVYALAATLYSLLTAQVPFPANFRKQGISLPPPKQLNSSISDRVNNAIITGMGLEPQDRPQTVQEWLELLKPNPKSEIQNLKSLKIDYTQLRDLLAAGKWREADEETARVMVAVAGQEKGGWLDPNSINNFPCEDLRIIDELWVKHSKGRFGFSVQKRIYQSLGGTREYNEEIWEAFGDCVGWGKKNRWIEWILYKDLTFELVAPVAHLPVCTSALFKRDSFSSWGFTDLGLLFDRIETCKI